MDDPSRRPSRPALYLGLALFLLLIGGGGLAWLVARQGLRAPLKVVLVSAAAEGAGDLDSAQIRALGALVQDHLEQFGGFAVTSLTDLPEDLEPLQDRPRTLLVLLEPRRKGDLLELGYRFVWGRALVAGRPLPWASGRAQPLPPGPAFDAFLKGFPVPVARSGHPLLPEAPEVFWDLVQAGAWRLQNARLEEALALAERSTVKAPGSASAWMLLGNLRYRWMLDRPSAFRQERADTEACLGRGLALAPAHPRGTFLLSLLKSDRGNQAEALDLLLQARQRQPHNPTLLTGIAYAARGAGLLALSRRAVDLRDGLAVAQLQPQSVDITCLYTGEFSRFEATLREQPGHLRTTSGVLPFYRGYLALVRGDRPRALQEFHVASEKAHGYQTILRLSEIFQLILEGQKDQAWKQLREFDQDRIGMREPDGEFTIRMAEAYALLGDRASALEMANRAFARGFGCTAWYERSPMLEPLRALPKWKALMQHVRERQKLMEERFPLNVLEAG
jgi:tetratricopeptide (TPR) repeat protein